ncbi:uncharacterized protein LOC101849270 [Aplysia californica]|uniref:Uncharacterized protein LOC101849270 n=1 Tax=Aplysia californica TaxID=6500 RepID=A0ABM1AEU3_APLCA|nr:uncharacterized protein LOC101849270 [Aplysia californica]
MEPMSLKGARGQLLLLEPHRQHLTTSAAVATTTTAAAAATAAVKQQQQQPEQQFQRSQSSSAPPALTSDTASEGGGHLRDRRSTRSLEALFQVTDSELQNMREDTPVLSQGASASSSSSSASGATTATTTTVSGEEKYIVVDNLHLMERGEATQIIITTSSDGPDDGSAPGTYYTVTTSTVADPMAPLSASTPGAQVVEATEAQIVNALSGEKNSEMLRLFLQSHGVTARQQATVTPPPPPPPLQHKLQQQQQENIVSSPAVSRSSGVPPLQAAGGGQVAATGDGDGSETGVVPASPEKKSSSPGRKRIHPQKPGKYQCKYCQRTCAKPSVLEKHLRAHTNERPFPCVVCGVSFKTKSNLSKHCKSNAHVSRTGISWGGSKDSTGGGDGKEAEMKVEEDEGDSEGTDTDVEGAGAGDKEDEDQDLDQPKVVVERTEGVAMTELAAAQTQAAAGQLVRQERVLVGIRQRIDKNKRQQQLQEQLEREGRSKWFVRLFNAFDKPSESEMAKYDEAETLTRENILGMSDILGATEILNQLEELKNSYKAQYPSAVLPVLMTHQPLPGDKMTVKILKPKKVFMESATAANFFLSSPSSSVDEISPAASSASLVMMSSGSVVGQSRPRPQVTSHSSDLSERISSDLSQQQRPKLMSHRSDLSVGSLRSVFSQSSRESVLSSPSIDESGVAKQPTPATRNPALGSSNNAAFSNPVSQDDGLLTLGPQHRAHSQDLETRTSYSPASSVTSDMVMDRIEMIITNNAEIMDRHSVSEPPRPRNRYMYMRQTSDSSYQTLRISDLRPGTESASVDRLTVEPPGDKLWKKKLAASLSVGDTDGATLRPDFVKRSMSTSSLKKESTNEGAVKSGQLQNIAPLPAENNKLGVTGVSGVVLPGSTGHPLGAVLLPHQPPTLHAAAQPGSSVLPIMAAKVTAPADTPSMTSGQVVQKAGMVESQLSAALPPSQLSSLTPVQMEALKTAQLVYVPITSLPRQVSAGESSLTLKTLDASHLTTERKPQSPSVVGGLPRFQTVASTAADTKPKLLQTTSDTTQPSTIMAAALNAASPSGGRLNIQPSSSQAGVRTPQKTSVSTISIPPHSIPASMPAKIVQGPGPHEIQIQIKLSKNANDQAVALIQPSVHASVAASSAPVASSSPASATLLAQLASSAPLATPSPLVTARTAAADGSNSSSSNSSIISSILQAPRQLSPMIGQPGVQFPARSKTGSPLLASRSFSGLGSSSFSNSSLDKTPTASLMQTGSLDSILARQDSNSSPSTAQSRVLGLLGSGSLHDQKKSMSRQTTGSNSLSSQGQTTRPSYPFMSELQHRLSVTHPPADHSPVKGKLAAAVSGTGDKSSSQVLLMVDGAPTAEHFRRQGLSDNLAAAASDYVKQGLFQCEDCRESFEQQSQLSSHHAQGCPRARGLRRSLSAMDAAAVQSQELKALKSSQRSQLSADVLFVGDAQHIKKANPALLKSLSTNDAEHSHMEVVKEQLTAVSATSQEIKQQQQQNLVMDSLHPSQPRRKGRPKGSKNRPKDLNLVLAKASAKAQVTTQALLAGNRQGTLGTLTLDTGKQKESSTAAGQTLTSGSQVLLLQGSPFPKLILPMSAAVTSATGQPSSSSHISLPISEATAATLNMLTSVGGVAASSGSMIGQPMVPVVPAGSGIMRQLSSGSSPRTPGLLSASTKSGSIAASVPIISVSPAGAAAVSLPTFNLSGTSSVPVLPPGTPLSISATPFTGLSSASVSGFTPGTPLASLTPGTPLASLTPGTPKSGLMLGFPLAGLPPGTPGTPITPLTPTNHPLALAKVIKPQSSTDSAPHLSAVAVSGGVQKLTSGPGLTLNITSAQSVGSAQFSQNSPRVIPCIPAVSFHSGGGDNSSLAKLSLTAASSVASPLPDTRSLQPSVLRMSQLSSAPGSSHAATPDTPTELLSGTMRRLKDKLLLKQSLSLERSHERTTTERSLSMDPSALSHHHHAGTPTPRPPAPEPPLSVVYPVAGSKQAAAPPSSNSVLLASLTKPVVSSQKLGSQPNAVITSAVMGKSKDSSLEKTAPEPFFRSESETPLVPEGMGVKSHPPVMRAFSEPAAAAKKVKKVKPSKPSPLSIEEKNVVSSSSSSSSETMKAVPPKILSSPSSKLSSAASVGSDGTPSKKQWSLQCKMESGCESFDSGMFSMSQDNPFVFPKVHGGLDSHELTMDLSDDTFNNKVTVPINYAAHFIHMDWLQSGPLRMSWRSQRTLLPLTLPGSRIQLPAVSESGASHKDTKNWLLKRSLSLHSHFQILVYLWTSSSPITLDSMTAMAIARGNPSPTLLGHAIFSSRSHLSLPPPPPSSSEVAAGNSTTASGCSDGAKPAAKPEVSSFPPPAAASDSIDLTREEGMEMGSLDTPQPLGKLSIAESFDDADTSEGSSVDKEQQTPSDASSLRDNQTSVPSSSSSSSSLSSAPTPLQLLIPMKSASATATSVLAAGGSSSPALPPPRPPHSSSSSSSSSSSMISSLLSSSTPPSPSSLRVQVSKSTTPSTSSSSLSSSSSSSFEQLPPPPATPATPSGSLNSPMYGHWCPTLYTTSHVTFCCIQRPQPMYVAVKGSKRVSMYSDWRLATHNPNPEGLTSRMLLALYKSHYVTDPVYAQCAMLPTYGGTQTHSSYWTYQRKKLGLGKRGTGELVKSEDGSPAMGTGKSAADMLVYSKDGKRHKLKLSKGGFKSDEKYEYVRGRGWGKYICEACGIRCKKPSMLKKHLRTHTDLRPYHCRHCRFSFKTKGNLTKHMKSKSHQKKCIELGIYPVPTSVDDSQIDPTALEEQCRISREARIHDSMDAQATSGDEDEDMDLEDEDGDEEDDEEEDEGMSREDGEEQPLQQQSVSSFDQERSGSSSPRVLKRQSSVDEASPVFSFGPGQSRSRSYWDQNVSRSRNRDVSESSNVSYSSQSSLENRTVSPHHNIDAEIARSLLDLSQPRKSESREIVDEDAHRHAQSHLQTLISQLLSQTKPLSGLNLGASDSLSLSLSPSPATAQGSAKPVLSTLLRTSSSQDAEPMAGRKGTGSSTSASSDVRRLRQISGAGNIAADVPSTAPPPPPPAATSGTTIATAGDVGSQRASPDREREEADGDSQSADSGKQRELFIVTDESELAAASSATRRDRPMSLKRRRESAGLSLSLPPSPSRMTATSSSSSSPPAPAPARPNQLFLQKSPLSPGRQQQQQPATNLPSPSLLAFLPAYVSSRQALKGRSGKPTDQGPIIGQFVRKDSQMTSSTASVALTPSLVLAGQSQPFQFNIPFPGGAGAGGLDTPVTPSASSTTSLTSATSASGGSKGFPRTIPIVTITDTSGDTPSPTADTPFARLADPLPSQKAMPLSSSSVATSRPITSSSLTWAAVGAPTSTISTTTTTGGPAFFSSAQTVTTFSSSSSLPSLATIKTSVSGTALSSVSGGISSVIKTSSIRPSLESKGRSNSDSATSLPGARHDGPTKSLPPRRDSAIESLIRKSAMPMLLMTGGAEYADRPMPSPASTTTLVTGDNSATGTSLATGRASSATDDNTQDQPAAKRVRRLSSGKSRFLRRQRSLADDSAFLSLDKESPSSLESLKTQSSDGSVPKADVPVKTAAELVKSKSLQDRTTSSVEPSSTLQSSRNSARGEQDSEKVEGETEEEEKKKEGRVEAGEQRSAIGQVRQEVEKQQTSCMFCSETFANKEAHNTHLRSQKHIWVLENLGILPSGTYEKLRQSERQEKGVGRSREEEEEKVKQELEMEKQTLDGLRMETSAADGVLDPQPASSMKTESAGTAATAPPISSAVGDRVRAAGVMAAAAEGKGEASKAGLVAAVPLVGPVVTDVPLLRRAYSCQEGFMTSSALGGAGGSSSGVARPQRPAYKRKISHQPVTEKATLLFTPHLNESLRQSLAKRARLGLAHSAAAQSGDPEPESEGLLVIDEEKSNSGGSSGVTMMTTTATTTTMTNAATAAVAAAVVPLMSTSLSASSSPPSVAVATGTTAAAILPVALFKNLEASKMSLSSDPPPLTRAVGGGSEVAASPPRAARYPTTVSSSSSSSPLVTGQSVTELTAAAVSLTSAPPPPLCQTVAVASTSMPTAATTVSLSLPAAEVAALPLSTVPVTSVSIVPSSVTNVTAVPLSVPSLPSVTRAHSCGLCDKAFPSLELLKRHLLSHAEPRPYVCQFCDAGFTNDRALRTHLLTHGQDRPYICGNCGDTFARPQDLQLHYSSHSSTSIRQPPTSSSMQQGGASSSSSSSSSASVRQMTVSPSSSSSSSLTPVGILPVQTGLVGGGSAMVGTAQRVAETTEADAVLSAVMGSLGGPVQDGPGVASENAVHGVRQDRLEVASESAAPHGMQLDDASGNNSDPNSDPAGGARGFEATAEMSLRRQAEATVPAVGGAEVVVSSVTSVPSGSSARPPQAEVMTSSSTVASSLSAVRGAVASSLLPTTTTTTSSSSSSSSSPFSSTPGLLASQHVQSALVISDSSSFTSSFTTSSSSSFTFTSTAPSIPSTITSTCASVGESGRGVQTGGDNFGVSSIIPTTTTATAASAIINDNSNNSADTFTIATHDATAANSSSDGFVNHQQQQQQQTEGLTVLSASRAGRDAATAAATSGAGDWGEDQGEQQQCIQQQQHQQHMSQQHEQQQQQLLQQQPQAAPTPPSTNQMSLVPPPTPPSTNQMPLVPSPALPMGDQLLSDPPRFPLFTNQTSSSSSSSGTSTLLPHLTGSAYPPIGTDSDRDDISDCHTDPDRTQTLEQASVAHESMEYQNVFSDENMSAQESMEYQSGFDGESTQGFTLAEDEEEEEGRNVDRQSHSDPVFLPQTYYGLS